MTGSDLGRDRGKANRQFLDRFLADGRLQAIGKSAAADDSSAADPDVEVADDAPHRQRARPLLEHIELAVGVAAADQCADRGADDNVGHYATGLECTEDSDMGKAPRRSA